LDLYTYMSLPGKPVYSIIPARQQVNLFSRRNGGQHGVLGLVLGADLDEGHGDGVIYSKPSSQCKSSRASPDKAIVKSCVQSLSLLSHWAG
jgi:hypothetical protein